MESITLGQIASAILLISSVLGALIMITKWVKQTASRWLTSGLSGIDKKLDRLSKDISEVDMSQCKNFLVRFLADIEQGNEIDEVELQRFWEVYEHYTSPKLKGNSYVQEKVEKLKKSGKL